MFVGKDATTDKFATVQQDSTLIFSSEPENNETILQRELNNISKFS